MASTLADTLDRAGAFLRALGDVPEPELRQDQPGMDLEFIWQGAYGHSVWVFVGIEEELNWGQSLAGQHAEWTFAFDGEHIPPEIVDAIRRVTHAD